jgi:hypothetical protein
VKCELHLCTQDNGRETERLTPSRDEGGLRKRDVGTERVERVAWYRLAGGRGEGGLGRGRRPLDGHGVVEDLWEHVEEGLRRAPPGVEADPGAFQRGCPRRSLTHGGSMRLPWRRAGGELGAPCVPGGQHCLHATNSSAGPLLELRADGKV